MLAEVLRVQFINGIRAEALKRKLLGAEDESLDQLLTRARSFEQVESELRASRQADKTDAAAFTAANFVKSQYPSNYLNNFHSQQRRTVQTQQYSSSNNPARSNCHRCGGTNHDQSACWYKDKVCNSCGKTGHNAKVCRSGKRNATNLPRNSQLQVRQTNAQHQLESCSADATGDSTVNALSSNIWQARHVDIMISGAQIRMELDTGSAHTVVSERVWRTIGSPALSTAPQLTDYGGFALPIRGSAQILAKFRQEERSSFDSRKPRLAFSSGPYLDAVVSRNANMVGQCASQLHLDEILDDPDTLE